MAKTVLIPAPLCRTCRFSETRTDTVAGRYDSRLVCRQGVPGGAYVPRETCRAYEREAGADWPEDGDD